MAKEIAGLYGDTQKFFSYIDMQSPNACQNASIRLAAFVADRGPFDAIMAFSEGASVATTFMLGQASLGLSPFKIAVFFCGGTPADPAALERGRIRLLVPENSGSYLIDIPTVHVYGENDPRKLEFGVHLSQICRDDGKSVIIHSGGHEIPGRRMDTEVVRILDAIHKAMLEAGALSTSPDG